MAPVYYATRYANGTLHGFFPFVAASWVDSGSDVHVVELVDVPEAEATHWAWAPADAPAARTLVQSSRVLLGICFPDSLKRMEADGDGRVVPIRADVKRVVSAWSKNKHGNKP